MLVAQSSLHRYTASHAGPNVLLCFLRFAFFALFSGTAGSLHEQKMLRTLDIQCTQRPLIFGQKTSFIVYYGYFSYCLPSLRIYTCMCLLKDECKYAHIVTCNQFLFARIRNTETNKRIKQQNLPSVEICMRFVTKSLTNLLGSFSAQWMVRYDLRSRSYNLIPIP